MSRRKLRGEARYIMKEIEKRGYKVVVRDWVEEEYPGLLGYYGGMTDREKKVVTIGIKALPTRERVIEALRHELHHVVDPDWDCGNRLIKWGRG